MLRFGIVVSILLLTASSLFSKADPVARVTVSEMTKAQYLDFREMGFDVTEVSGSRFTIYANPEEVQLLKSAGIQYEVEEPDMAAYYAKRSVQQFGGYRTFQQIVDFLDSISAAHPAICGPKFSIGKSIEGRDQWVIKVSDNPNVDEDEPEVFYNSIIHAREPIGGATLLNMIAHLMTNYGTDPNVTYLVDNRELYFLPVINPDGYVYNETTNPEGGGMWRKNRHQTGVSTYGIDLNRNFGYAWGYDNYGSSPTLSGETYRGPSAFSEPETDNVRNFVNSRHFSVCNNLHAYAGLFLWPWGYDRIYSTQDDFFRVVGDSMAKYAAYTPEIAWTLYPTNGAADDWMYGDTTGHKRFVSLTTEIGINSDGFWPLESRIAPLVNENLGVNLFLARMADNPYRLGPPDKPVATLSDSAAPDFTLRWSDPDTINPPVSYKVYELTGKQTVTDDAESNYGYWTPARMALNSTRKHGGSYSWHSQNANGVQHWLIANTPYHVKPGDSLVFWIWYDLETAWDYFYAQVASDGGFEYVNLPGNLTTNDNPNVMNYGNGITGSSGGVWKRAAYDLSAYAGGQVFIRLSMFTDGYTLGEGVYLDDIACIDKFGSETLIAPAAADTTLALSGKALGTYWYRIRAVDAEGQQSRLSNLVVTTVYEQYMVGDLSGDGFVDLSDLSNLVSYLTSGSPVPQPMARANVNCAGIVDLSDLSFLVRYLTNGGSKPNCS